MASKNRSLFHGCVFYMPPGDIRLRHSEFIATVQLIKALGGIPSSQDYTHVIIIRPAFSSKKLDDTLDRLPESRAPVLDWEWLKACEWRGRRLNWGDDWDGHLLRARASGTYRPSSSFRPSYTRGDTVPSTSRARSRSPPRRYPREALRPPPSSSAASSANRPIISAERPCYDPPSTTASAPDRSRDPRLSARSLERDGNSVLDLRDPSSSNDSDAQAASLNIDTQRVKNDAITDSYMLPTPPPSCTAQNPPTPQLTRSSSLTTLLEKEERSSPSHAAGFDQQERGSLVLAQNSTAFSQTSSPTMSSPAIPRTVPKVGEESDGQGRGLAMAPAAPQVTAFAFSDTARPERGAVPSPEASSVKQRLFVDEFGDPLRFRVYGTEFERRMLKRELGEYGGVVLARTHPVDRLPVARYTVFPTGTDRVIKDPDQKPIARQASLDRSTTVVCADWVQQCIERGRLIRPDLGPFGVVLPGAG